jgi:hypothetical protein
MKRADECTESIEKTFKLLFRLGRKSATLNAISLSDKGVITSCTGWKVGYLTDPIGQNFAGLNNGTYKINDFASCSSFSHEAPHPTCDCGFHIYHDKVNAEYARYKRWGSVLIQVELFGEIVRHATGSRGEEQVVTKVWFPDRCERIVCSGKSVGACQISTFFVAACEAHLKNGFSFADLRLLLGIPVSTTK